MWSNLDDKARTNLAIAISVLVAVTVIALVLVFSSNKSNLFTGLDEKEAANVINELEDMKIPYELSKGGENILVDEKVVEQVRLKLIGKGVRIQSGEGFELFDDADIGMTEYSQKINYLRALQGELARSIMSIDGIKYARVHLVLPETSVFKQNKQKPTASITVIPEAGVQLTAEQIVGIQRMISAATPGVTQKNVTVQDNKGVTLSGTSAEADGDQITTLILRKKREAEAYLESKVNVILNKAFGDGNAVAIISVDLVVDKVHRKEEIVIPHGSKNDGLLRKRETNTGGGKDKSSANNKTVDLEYQISKRIEEIVSMPGAIERISVGILVPEGADIENLVHLQEVISMAVGLDPTRGDDVAIYPMKSKSGIATSQKQAVENEKIVKADETVLSNNQLVNESALSKMVTYQQLLYLTVGLMVFILFLIIVMYKSSRKSKLIQQQELTMRDKEKLLSDIKIWVNEGAA